MDLHDLGATISAFPGEWSHTKLTFKFQGHHFRLTDVKGNAVRSIMT